LGARLGLRRIRAELELPPGAGRLRARLYELEAVRGERHDEHGWTLSLDIAEADAAKLASHAYGEALRSLLLVATGTPA
jgi:GTP-binding protein HflX